MSPIFVRRRTAAHEDRDDLGEGECGVGAEEG